MVYDIHALWDNGRLYDIYSTYIMILFKYISWHSLGSKQCGENDQNFPRFVKEDPPII